MLRFILYGIFIPGLFLIYSCNSQKKLVKKQNQAMLYQPSAAIVRPEYLIYHSTDAVSQLLIKINLYELLFNQANLENKLMAKIHIRYQLTDITNNISNSTITDSSTWTRSFEKLPDKQFIALSIPVRAKYGNIYRIKIEIYDLIRELGNTGYITVNKKNKESAQNFKLYSSEFNAPIFKNYLSSTDSFKIQLNTNAKKLYIKYHAENLVLPPPPFSSIVEPLFSFQSDSLWILPYNISTAYHLPYKGIYLIQTDTLATEGLYLANLGESFPNVNEVQAMVQPLEYLTTTEEFKNIATTENTKIALDNFWMKLSHNIDISRELIRIYYNRMQFANNYFNSYKPGWKTDRGMIYMIFGPPSYIKKTELTEIWEYYVKQDATNLSIHFLKTDTPYSENHYIMQRSVAFSSYWRDAVSSWRSGNAYSLEE